MRVLGAFLGAVAGAMLGSLVGPEAAGVTMLVGALLGGIMFGRGSRGPASRTGPNIAGSIPAPPVSVGSQRLPEEFTDSFLEDALSLGLIDGETHDQLVALLHGKTLVGTGTPTPPPPRPGGAVPVAPFAPERGSIVEPVFAPMPMRQVPSAPPASPSPISAWFSRVRDSVVSDVAVHGLAYLGVFLVFAGALGFFLFSFGSLSLAARPWAELAIPSVLLGSAVFLRHREAPVAATALGVAGGVLLPVVLLASYVDRVAFPPDFAGAALGWAAIATSLALAALYAMSVRVFPESSLRFLAAPLLWTAAWSVGILTAGTQAQPLKEWTAGQFAFVSIAVAATCVVVRRWPDLRLSREARASRIPGVIVTLGMGLMLAGGEGWTWWVLVTLGLASTVSTDTLEDRLGPRVVRVLPGPLLWLAATGLYVRFDAQVAGPVLVVASLALFEWETWRGRGGVLPAGTHAAGIAAGLVLAVSVVEAQPWAIVAALAPVVVWSQVRRLTPIGEISTELQRAPIDALAVSSPIGLAAALVAAARDDVAFLAISLSLCGLSLLARRRGDDVGFAWWVVAVAVVLGVVGAAWPSLPAMTATAVVGLSTLAVVPPLVSTPLRGWLVVAGAWTTWWLGAEALGVTVLGRWTALALAAAAVTIAASWRSERLAMNVGLASWLAATVGVLGCAIVTDADPWLVVALGAWTLATGVASVQAELHGRGPAELAAASIDAWGIGIPGRVVPVALTLAGLASLLVASDATWPSIPLDLRVALSALAFAEAGATWLLRRREVTLRTTGIGAFVLAAVAAGAAAPDLEISVWTLTLGVLSVAALAPAARLEAMSWVAWAGSGALAIQAGRLAGLERLDLPPLALAWSGSLALGALTIDDAREGRKAAGVFVRLRGCLAPAALGLAVLPVAAVLSLTGSDLRIAVFATVGAAVVGQVAWLLGLGSVSAGSYALASVAVAVSIPWSPADHPWLAVPWAAVLATIGALVRPRDRATRVARRWDIPAFAVGAAGLAAALAQAVVIDDVAVTWSAVGVLLVAVAWVLRSPWLAMVGRALVVVGALDAGHGWAALVLSVVAVAISLTAARYGGEHRAMCAWHQAGAAIVAASALWELRAYTDWGWGTLAGIALTCVVVSLLAGIAILWRRPASVWIWQSGFVVAAMQGLGFLAAGLDWPVRETTVAALLIAAGASVVIGSFRRIPVLTMAGPVLAGAAWLVSLGELLRGSAMWWAAPAGLLLLVESGIVRVERRAQGLPMAHPTTSFLELAGMASLLAPPLVEIFTKSPARGLVAVGLGLALAGWGTLTKVRRRLFGGVAGVVAAVFLMLAGPIAKLVPNIEGPALWGALALIGLVLIAVATGLERGRARLARALHRIDEVLGSWE
jgi:hypothetical protein